MGSKNLFMKCKTCGKTISRSASVCPGCKTKQKKLSIIHWIGIILGILILFGIVVSSNNSNTENNNQIINQAKTSQDNIMLPSDQKDFSQIIKDYAEEYKISKNQLEKSVLRDKRKIALNRALQGYKITSWVGTINGLDTNTEGKAILSIRVSPYTEIKTWNNAFSDIFTGTLIKKGTTLYNQLLKLSIGNKVRFSGNFISSQKDYIEETSLTEEGSMINPEYLMQFNSVNPI